MWHAAPLGLRQPQTRDEADLLSTLTLLIHDIEGRIVDYGYGNFRIGKGLRQMGLLVLLDNGLMFLPQTESFAAAQDGIRGTVWTDVAGVGVKNKMIGHEVTVTTRSLGQLTCRVTSPTLGSAVQAAWHSTRSG